MAGLAQIKHYGGVAIVQKSPHCVRAFHAAPGDRACAGDYVAALADIPPLLVSLAQGTAREEIKVIQNEPVERIPLLLRCPKCRGPLTEERQNKTVEYWGGVGHAAHAGTRA
jgi:hypothetical protein